MKQFKKVVALAMAATMVLSSSVLAFADDATAAPATGSAAGVGDIEGYVDKNIFTVTLPTVTDINFTLDPQELRLAAETAGGGTATTTLDVDGTASAITAGYGAKVLFLAADNTNFLSKSVALKVVNKSTFDVQVSMTTKLTGLASPEAVAPYDVKVIADTETATATSTAISMKLQASSYDITGSTEANLTSIPASATALTASTEGVKTTDIIKAATNYADAYKVTGNKTSGYKYELDATAAQSVAFNGIAYDLSGTVATKGDWTNFNKSNAELGVEISYTINKVGGVKEVYAALMGNTLYIASDNVASANPAKWPAGTQFTNCVATFPNGTTQDIQSAATVSNNWLSFNLAGIPSGNYTVTFTADGVDYTASFTK